MTGTIRHSASGFYVRWNLSFQNGQRLFTGELYTPANETTGCVASDVDFNKMVKQLEGCIW